MRHFFIPQVHATTFYKFRGELESMALRPNHLRENPYAPLAALPWAFGRFESQLLREFDWPRDIMDVGLPRAMKGCFVVPFYNGNFTIAQVADVGPWVIDDPYWRTGQRPRAERLFHSGGTVFSPQQQRELRVVSPAAVDFTPEVWYRLGVPYERAYADPSIHSGVVDLLIIENW